jgi:hypothetical protein
MNEQLPPAAMPRGNNVYRLRLKEEPTPKNQLSGERNEQIMAEETRTTEMTSTGAPETSSPEHAPRTGEAPALDAPRGGPVEGNQSNLLAEAGEKTEQVPPATPDQPETKTEGEKKSEEKGEEEKPAPRAPEEYAEFSLPEGAQIEKESLTEFKTFAKEQDLTQEQAQKVLEFGAQRIKAQLEAPYKAWSEMQNQWQAEVKADPEIGGTKYDKSIADAALVFQPGESNPFVKNAEEAQALKTALTMTGAGNNPAIVRMFVKMGRMLAEPGGLTGRPVKDSQDNLLAKMYPTMQ